MRRRREGCNDVKAVGGATEGGGEWDRKRGMKS